MKIFAALIALAAFPIAANAQTDTRAQAVIAHMRAALTNGVQRAAAVHVHGTLETIGLRGTEDLYVLPARKAFVERDDAGAASGQVGYTGTEAWSADAYGIVRAERFPTQRAQIVDTAYLVTNALIDPAHWPAAVTSGGVQSVNGAKLDLLHITPQGGSQFDLYVDTAGWLPVRISQDTGQGPLVTTLANYRVLGGVRIPTLQRTTAGGNESVFRVTSVTADAAGAQAALHIPQTTAHDFSIAGNGVATVPFDLVENHVYVHVRLNGQGPYTFIFDTGGLNIVTPQVAQALGAAQQGNANATGVGARTEQTRIAKVRTLQIGDAQLRDQNFVVLDIARGFGVSAGMHVDGLIGYEVLSRFITTFDYGAKRLTFALPGSQQLENPVDFAFLGDNPHLRASVNGIDGWFTVDTGNRASLVLDSPFVAAHPALAPAANAPTGAIGFGVGGASIGHIGRVRTLQIGTFTVRDPLTDFSTASAGAFSASSIAGNIGGGVWKRFAVTFDYPHQRMGLVPNANFAAPDTGDRSGLFLINNNGAITVYDVLTNTPAAVLGLRKGDIITAVDGTAATSLQSVRAALQGPPGTRVTLTLKRDTDPAVTRVITLEDYA